MSGSLSIRDDGKRTLTVTFRLNENTITTLRAESERRHMILNTMINQILQDFTAWYMYEPKIEMLAGHD